MTRREWCAQLSVLVSPAFPLEAQTALNLMLPAMQHLSDSMFTTESLMQVAGAKRRQSVPSWDEIVVVMNEHRSSLNLWVNREPMRIEGNDELGEQDVVSHAMEAEAVTAKLAQHWREQAEAKIAREAARPKGIDSKPLRDVTFKGEALRQLREARGVKPIGAAS